MSRPDFYANNHTELAANTPRAIGPNGASTASPGVKIARINITATLTGNLAVYDGSDTTGALLLLAATPAAGTQYDMHVRCKNGCWVVPGTAGTASVFWD